MIPSLSQRRRIPELMDDPAIDPLEHRRALEGLARINRWSGSAGVLWPVVQEVARRKGGNPIKVLDVATGAGDVPLALWRLAKNAKMPAEFVGCDVSQTAIDHAAGRAAEERAHLRFFRHDAVRDPLPGRYDLVVCSLFLHHLSETEATAVLRHMRDAADAVAVNDLARSRINYILVWIASHLLSRSPVVHFDGPVSVQSAFTASEVKALAERASLNGAEVVSRWPCRLLLTWSWR
jgi:2-polyprenyl-3-methyl-5-hydroxy-6-metoxy-1,4-benzoquinol methylase